VNFVAIARSKTQSRRTLPPEIGRLSATFERAISTVCAQQPASTIRCAPSVVLHGDSHHTVCICASHQTQLNPYQTRSHDGDATNLGLDGTNLPVQQTHCAAALANRNMQQTFPCACISRGRDPRLHSRPPTHSPVCAVLALSVHVHARATRAPPACTGCPASPEMLTVGVHTHEPMYGKA
jgi:hypothetical protein